MTVNLLNFDKTRMNDFCVQMGERSFHAKQLLRWVHQHGESDFSKMSDLANAFRGKLTDTACVVPPKLVSESTATDGTRKWVLSVGNDNCIETIFIPEENRGTLCISSQVGCALACTFCSTGRQGFNKNLSAAEIIGQLWWANKALGRSAKSERIVSNVVFMGMGEPLLNYDNVVTALNIMLDDFAYGLSRRRVTLSTSGIVPAIDRLREECPVALAVSLHASNNALRDILVPVNSRYPLQELMAACKRYVERAPRDFITFEYVMLKDVNDGVSHARELIRLVADVPCKFNLIPFNPFLNSGYERSTPESITQFRNILVEGGIVTTVRKTRGDDIAAACGQLAGQVQDKVNRQVRQQIGAK